MKYFFLPLLLMTTITTFSQNDSLSRWSVGLSFTPEIGYPNITENGFQTADEDGFKDEREAYLPYFTYSTGIPVVFRFNNWIGLESGVYYSLKGFKTRSTPFVADMEFQFNTKMHYIDIPLKARFEVGRGKLKWISSIGVSGSIFMKGKGYSTVRKGESIILSQTNSLDEDVRKFLVNAEATSGMSIALPANFSLRVEALFRHSLNSSNIIQNYDESELRYWNAGIAVSVLKRF